MNIFLLKFFISFWAFLLLTFFDFFANFARSFRGCAVYASLRMSGMGDCCSILLKITSLSCMCVQLSIVEFFKL